MLLSGTKKSASDRKQTMRSNMKAEPVPKHSFLRESSIKNAIIRFGTCKQTFFFRPVSFVFENAKSNYRILIASPTHEGVPFYLNFSHRSTGGEELQSVS